MTPWPQQAVTQITTIDDLRIHPYRADGKTLGTPTWIWPAAVGGCLVVRGSSGGRGPRWHGRSSGGFVSPPHVVPTWGAGDVSHPLGAAQVATHQQHRFRIPRRNRT